MMTSSPNLALFHIELDGITSLSSSNPMKTHDRVVCSFFPLFLNTDTTFGCSTQKGYLLEENKHNHKQRTR